MPFGSGPFGTVPFGSGPRRQGVSPVLSQFTVRIGSTEVRPYLRWNIWRVTEVLNSRDTSTMNFLVKPTSPNPNYVPQLGERVQVRFGNVLYWTGLVHDREMSWTTEARNDLKEITLRCVDLTALCDRLTVNEVYVNKTAGEILRHIVSKYLAADGLTSGGVQDGPVIAKVVFARRYAADCFDAVCKLTGYHWTVDQGGVLQYFPRFASLAPFDISHANARFRQARTSVTLADFRNVQYATGGMGITQVPVTDFHIGDDIARTFATAYPISSLVSVKVNGAVQSLGIRNVDDAGSKAWYWNKSQAGINQDPSQPILKGRTASAPADRLEITYHGFYGPVATKLVNAPSIAERRTIEGGSGRYEVVDYDQSLDGLAVTIAKAKGDLRRHGTLDPMMDFETDEIGLAVGQTVTIKLPELDVPDVDMLITELETSLFGMEKRRHRVKATAGELKGTYQEFFQHIFSKGGALTISPDDSINEVVVDTDPVSATDLATLTTSAAHTGKWGQDTWGRLQWG